MMISYPTMPPQPANHIDSKPAEELTADPSNVTSHKHAEEKHEAHERLKPHQHIWLVTGPAGSGKSTVAENIAQHFKLPFVEGDNFHPKANIEKMSKGIPLTDADRWDWLTLLREEALKQLSSGKPGVVLTCSALKKKYRDVIRVAPYKLHGVQVHFVFLNADEKVLTERVMARKGHYMNANMVHSQFEALENPDSDETDVITIDVSVSKEEVEAEAIRLVNKVVEEDQA